MNSTHSFPRLRAAVATAVIALLPVAVSAQTPSRTQFGALIGLSSTSITDADLDGVAELGVSAETKRRMGFQIGAYLTRQLSGNLSFQPEVHYIQKGAKVDVSISDIEGGAGSSTAEASIKFAYLEVPLLLRYDMNQGKSVRPFLVAGPAVALRISCNIGLGFEGASLNTDCADADDGETESDDPFKKFDAGVMVGGGISGTLSARPVSLQVRYSYGLINISTQDADGRSPRNTGISLLFGIGF
jgi:hypothetical protein